MNQCLLCDQEFIVPIMFHQIFSLTKLSPSQLCAHCLSKFEKLNKISCPICSKNTEEAKICADCQLWQEKYQGNLLKNIALYRYNNYFHDLMVAYKRYGDFELHHVLKELCQSYVRKLPADLYVPIPTSPEHQAQRKFDTVSAIFEGIVPLTPILKKKSGSKAQGEKNRQERLMSAQSFLIDKNIKIGKM